MTGFQPNRGYQPDFDLSRIAAGENAERMVAHLRSAVLLGDCEVKLDDAASKYRNVFFEHKCLRSGQWTDSAIRTTKAQNWAHVIGHGRIVIWMPTWLLRQVLNREPRIEKPGNVSGDHPTKGVVVPLERLLPAALDALEAPTQEKEAAA